MPPAGGFESNPKVPGIGPINLMELQFAEQKLQFGPAAKLTLRQLAESTKDPSKIPGGVTPEDLAKIKRLLARVPGTNTGAFILQNGNTTVRQFIQDNIRVRIPRPEAHRYKKGRRYKSSKKRLWISQRYSISWPMNSVSGNR
jgi:hypothetical protein